MLNVVSLPADVAVLEPRYRIVAVAACFASAFCWGMCGQWYRCQKEKIGFSVVARYLWVFFIPGSMAAVAFLVFESSSSEGLVRRFFPSAGYLQVAVIGFLFGLAWDIVAFPVLAKLTAGFPGVSGRFEQARLYFTGEFGLNLHFEELCRREVQRRSDFRDDFSENDHSLTACADALREVGKALLDKDEAQRIQVLSTDLYQRWKQEEVPKNAQLKGFAEDLLGEVDANIRDDLVRRLRKQRVREGDRLGDKTLVPKPPLQGTKEPVESLRSCERVVVLTSGPIDPPRSGTGLVPSGMLTEGFRFVSHLCSSGDGVVFLDDSISGAKPSDNYSCSPIQLNFLNSLCRQVAPNVPLVLLRLDGREGRLGGRELDDRWVRHDLPGLAEAGPVLDALQLAGPVTWLGHDSRVGLI